ncbi:MAG: Acetyl xylan esterase [Mucilaginibacter sp.]|nr:Acetyl xylan esterase [Mucilaginibacter sp.]
MMGWYMKKLYALFTLLLILVLAVTSNPVIAQNYTSGIVNNASSDEDSGEVSTILTAHDKNAIFDNVATYTFEVKNTYNKPQAGKVTYLITDQFNKKLRKDSILINVEQHSSRSYDFTLPPLKSGFYKVNFMINVTDYDDTIRRVFGIRPDEIRSAHSRPDDFDKFWETAKAQLAKVKPEYKITEKFDLEKDNRKVFLIEMKSLGNKTIYVWLTEPEHHQKYQKFPVLLLLPGYQATNIPLLGRDDDMAFVSPDVRGQGLSKENFDMRREDYIVNGLEDKNKYIMRGIIMDCIRAIDFIYSRPELGHDRIGVTGGSMGGYLSITTAALDKRVTFCAPQNPFMSDIYNMDNGAVEWPINYMKKYVTIRPDLTFEKALDNLQYFDTKNFASAVSCPVVMGIGLLDPFVPPNNSYVVFNSIKTKKKIFVFKDLGHEVGDKYYNYEIRFTRDTFGLF